MSDLPILTVAFLAVTAPLFVAVGVIGAGEVREHRHRTLARRGASALLGRAG